MRDHFPVYSTKTKRLFIIALICSTRFYFRKRGSSLHENTIDRYLIVSELVVHCQVVVARLRLELQIRIIVSKWQSMSLRWYCSPHACEHKNGTHQYLPSTYCCACVKGLHLQVKGHTDGATCLEPCNHNSCII